MLVRTVKMIADRVHAARDPIGFSRRIGVTVGEDCMIVSPSRATFGSEPYMITLGNHVAVAYEVRFVTHDGGLWVLRDKYPDIDHVAPIVVRDNVMIGLGAVIMPGVEVGPNSVIAARAVVTRPVPAGTVVAGTPARVICTLDEYEENALPRVMYTAKLPPEERKAAFLARGLRWAASSATTSFGPPLAIEWVEPDRTAAGRTR
jgi:acetyltransferase-like isoleucine patch superfamily enzyme